ALAKGVKAPEAGKPAAAPPELTALRDAVEMAAKKGENVQAVRKELDAVEKALTGRSYVRPKPVVVEPPPTPQPGTRRGGIVIQGNGNTIVIQGRGAGITNLNLGGQG